MEALCRNGRIKRLLKNVIESVKILMYCLKLSWNASGVYTMLRMFCSIVPPLMGIMGSFLSKYLLDLLADKLGTGKVPEVFFLLIGGICTIKILQNLSDKVEQYIQIIHNEIMNEKLAMMLMQRSCSADMEYFDNAEYYDKLQASARDSYSIAQILWNAMSFVGACFSFVGVFVVLWAAKPIYALLLTLTAIPHGMIATRYTKTLYNLSMEQINAERKKSYIQGITLEKRYAQDIRLFHIGKLLREKYYNIWKEVFTKRKQVLRKKTVVTIVFSCLPGIITVVVGMDIGLRIFAGTASIGDYSLYMGMMEQLLSAFFIMTYSLTNVHDNKLRITNFKSVLASKNKVLDSGMREVAQVDEIVLDQVSFTYPGTKKCVLNNVSLRFRKTEKTVLVGVNGSGKTTIIKLLLRLYEPDSGRILVNGVDIKEYRLESLRRNFSVYFQEMGNYCMSLYENVIIGDAEREDEQAVYKALEQSCCGDILDKAIYGLNTNLMRMFDKDGLELSGGQYQKIALARCLYRRSTVLVLDEPSSNLDPKAEHDIFEQIRQLSDNKLTIFTSHRLSNVSLADRIIVLEHGRVVEEGTQKELLEKNQRYAELYRYQSEKFNISESKKGSENDTDSID